MLVIVLIGLMASAIQFSFSSNKPQETLKQSSERFAGIFAVAVEYSMLNNVEMGVFIEDNTYHFVGYDGTRWTDIPEQTVFNVFTLPDGVEIELALDDLPLDEPQLFDSSIFSQEDDDEDFKREKEKKIIPQIYILSGGDITPFSLTFRFDETLTELEDIAYRVTGLYSTPLTIEGPNLEQE